MRCQAAKGLGALGSATSVGRLHAALADPHWWVRFYAAVALAAASSLADQPVRIAGLRTLRVKESDRIAALAAELGKLGCTVKTDGESIDIDPSARHDRPAVIDTHNDHRMAMAFAVLDCAAPRTTAR